MLLFYVCYSPCVIQVMKRCGKNIWKQISQVTQLFSIWTYRAAATEQQLWPPQVSSTPLFRSEQRTTDNLHSSRAKSSRCHHLPHQCQVSKADAGFSSRQANKISSDKRRLFPSVSGWARLQGSLWNTSVTALEPAGCPIVTYVREFFLNPSEQLEGHPVTFVTPPFPTDNYTPSELPPQSKTTGVRAHRLSWAQNKGPLVSFEITEH